MALLTLDTVWINAKDADGQWSDVIELASASGLDQTETSNMRVRAATGDRSVVTILPGGTSTWRLTCNLAVADEVAWLRAHRGQMLCFRDMHGEKIFGVISEVPRSPLTDGVHFGLTVTITQLDHSEAV